MTKFMSGFWQAPARAGIGKKVYEERPAAPPQKGVNPMPDSGVRRI